MISVVSRTRRRLAYHAVVLHSEKMSHTFQRTKDGPSEPDFMGTEPQMLRPARQQQNVKIMHTHLIGNGAERVPETRQVSAGLQPTQGLTHLCSAPRPWAGHILQVRKPGPELSYFSVPWFLPIAPVRATEPDPAHNEPLISFLFSLFGGNTFWKVLASFL